MLLVEVKQIKQLILVDHILNPVKTERDNAANVHISDNKDHILWQQHNL